MCVVRKLLAQAVGLSVYSSHLRARDFWQMAARGGRQQKRERAAAFRTDVAEDATLVDRLGKSFLALDLVRRWAWGRISATAMQSLAHLAYRDALAVARLCGGNEDAVPTPLRELASLGTWGRNTGNIASELVTYLREPRFPRADDSFKVPLLVRKPRNRQNILQDSKVPMFLPHVVFHHLFQHHRSKWEYNFLGDQVGKVDAFWKECVKRRDPRLSHHPMCARRGWANHAIPMAIHGDAVPVFYTGRPNSRSLDCLSWQSIFAFGPTLTVKMLITAVFEHCKSKGHADASSTMQEVWGIIVWSFAALFTGEFPSSDYRGNPWPPGSADQHLAGRKLCSSEEPWFGVVYSIKGDIVWFGHELQLAKHNEIHPCEWCQNVSTHAAPTLWPTNFAADAPWKQQILSPAKWREVRPDKHILFEKLTYLSIHNVECDELHVLHLGCSQYFVGSILWKLCYRLMDRSPRENLDRIWELILESYAAMPGSTQFTSLALSSFVDTAKPFRSYPKLKGRGAEVKNLVGPLWCALNTLGLPGDEIAQCKRGLKHLRDICNVLDDYRSEVMLPTPVAAAFQVSMDSFLNAYVWLANRADAADELCFSGAPKLHYAWHLAHRAALINPRRVACWLDEDFVREMKELAKGCASAAQLHRVPIFWAQKYRYGCDLEDRR